MSTTKKKYKVINWSTYNNALKNRYNLSLYFTANIQKTWYAANNTIKNGRPYTYSDQAIQLCLTIRYLLKLPLRGGEGFMKSMLKMAKLDLSVPDYTSIMRRGCRLKLNPKTIEGAPKESLHIVIDSTGLKVYGEGEWKVRTHGYTKRRTWRKLHLAVDANTHEIVAHSLTTNKVSDDHAFLALLEQIDQPISSCCADGAYDTKNGYQASHEKGADLIVPPRRGGVEHDSTYLKSRNEAIKRIQELGEGDLEKGRKLWKEESGYHQRSLAETSMFRYKTIIGRRLRSRRFDSQETEVNIGVHILNKMTKLGMPISVAS